MKHRHLICTCIFITFCILPLSAQPEIRPDHPRIFFNSETWPSLKQKVNSEKMDILKKLLADVRQMPDNPVADNVELPHIKNNIIVADSQKGRIFCQTFLPKDASLKLVGGEGMEFLSGDVNYAFDETYPEQVIPSTIKNGRGPYWGEWRLEVSPSELNETDQFLHVITAASVERKNPIKARYVKDENYDGINLKIDGEIITFWFSRCKEIAGKVEWNGVTRHLTNTVQQQKGFIK